MSRRDRVEVRFCESKVTKRRRRARERAEERERKEAAARFAAAPVVPTAAHEASLAELRKRAIRASVIPPGFRRVFTATGDYLEAIPGWTP